MPDLLPSCRILMRWRERRSRVIFAVPAHLRQHVVENPPPLFYPEEDIIFRPYEDNPQAQVEREERNARWPIFDPPYVVINWEGDIEPLPGYDAWLQEQTEARARWEVEFPPYDEEEDPYSSDEEDDGLFDVEEDEDVEEPIVLPYPDEDEDRDFFLEEIF